MSGDQIQRTAAAPDPTMPTALVPHERANSSSSARTSFNPPAGMQQLGRAPQAFGAPMHVVEIPHVPAPTLTPPAADSRLPSPSSSALLVRNLHAEIDDAVAHSKKYQAFIERISPTAEFESPNLLVARTSLQAMEAAQRGLDAFAKLQAHARTQPSNREGRKILEHERLHGALRFLVLRSRAVEPPDIVNEGVDSDAAMETLVVQRAEIEKALAEYRQILEQTLKAHDVVLAARNLPADLLNDSNRLGLAFLSFEWGQIEALTVYRLLTHGRELSSSLKDALNALIGIANANEHIFPAALRILTSELVDQQALPGALENMENMCSQVKGMAEQLCLIASRELESHSPTWKMALECADATRQFGVTLEDMMERGRRAPADPDSLSSASTAEPVAEPSADHAASMYVTAVRTSEGGAKRGGRKGKRRPLRTEPVADTVVTKAPADRLSLALDSARRTLAKSRPLTRQMAEGDPVELARAQGESIDMIDLFRRHHTDPMHIANAVRSSMPKWFGDLKQLCAASDNLAALPRAKLSDPDVVRQRGQLAERISILESMENKVTVREIEDIKQYPFPKERHLERLLELDEIGPVRAPILLPSSGDDAGSKDRVFEMEITLKPLADGFSAPPLYLHLHTEKQITAQAASRMPLNDFTAVHVKTAEQRRLGAKWEAMRKNLGYDDKVHRGPIGSKLLNRLRQRALAASPAS